MNRAEDLRADYDRLGVLLVGEPDGAKAAALVRERRLIGELLEGLESPVEVPFVDQLAKRRKSHTKVDGAAGRRKRQSG